MPESKSVKLLYITTVPISLTFITGYIDYLKPKGFDIQFLSSPGEMLETFAIRYAVQAHAVEMPRKITPLQDLRSIYGIWRGLRQERPHIVHTATPKGGLLGTIAAWFARCPVRIYHIYGLPYLTARGYKRFLLRWSEKISCLCADQVLCVSHSIKETAIKDSLCPAGKIKVLSHGSAGGIDATRCFNPALVDSSRQQSIRAQYGIPKDARIIGFLGRIVRDKGIIELVTAWNMLREEYPELHLLVVGPFEDQDPLPSHIEKQLRTDKRIHLASLTTEDKPIYYSIEDIALFYSIMEICVLPTYREGFPNALLEAAAMKIPIVATSVPGCIDAVQDGVTGILVPPYDAEKLADAIRRYLSDPELRHQHGKAGRERVLRDFRPEDLWAAAYTEYKHLLNEIDMTLEN